jgi:TolA-binding protein
MDWLGPFSRSLAVMLGLTATGVAQAVTPATTATTGAAATAGTPSAPEASPEDEGPLATPAPVVPACVPDAASARAFADHLLSKGDPFNAVTWYRLALFQDPTRGDADAIRFRIAAAYELGQRWDAAEVAYGLVEGTSLASRAAYRSAVVNEKAGRFIAADQQFESVTQYYPDTPWAARASFARGVVFLENRDLGRAALRFDAASTAPALGEPWPERAKLLASRAREPLPHRSPLVAAGLSTVLPGAGQLYSGHAGDGAMALVANGVLATWSATLLRDGIEHDKGWKTGMGTAIGAMFAVTWVSNIYGGWRSAVRFNEHKARRRAESLLGEASDPRLELDAASISLP